MSRKDMQLDAMLRHLGAAYYDSLHGRAASADVSRAVDQVAYELGDKPAVAHRAPAPASRGSRIARSPRIMAGYAAACGT